MTRHFLDYAALTSTQIYSAHSNERIIIIMEWNELKWNVMLRRVVCLKSIYYRAHSRLFLTFCVCNDMPLLRCREQLLSRRTEFIFWALITQDNTEANYRIDKRRIEFLNRARSTHNHQLFSVFRFVIFFLSVYFLAFVMSIYPSRI